MICTKFESFTSKKNDISYTKISLLDNDDSLSAYSFLVRTDSIKNIDKLIPGSVCTCRFTPSPDGSARLSGIDVTDQYIDHIDFCDF